MQVCEQDLCNGCGLCAEICHKNAIHIEDRLDALNAVIDKQKCISCNRCRKICPRNGNNPEMKYPILWKQGWSGDDMIRSHGSSGGAASDIMHAFIKNGGKIVSCTFEHGIFTYKLFDTLDQLEACAGSKYVKTSPIGIYQTVRSELVNKARVLFIGLPCHVAAIKNYVRGFNEEYLYTIDLVCHGSPSPSILDQYFADCGISAELLERIDFRIKNISLPEKTAFLYPPITMDSYLYAFLSRYILTENCYHCSYAHINRISDLTLGDSWGSELEEEEQNKGISLILCQTEKGKELLSISNLVLHDVDLDNAIYNNRQLQHPSEKPEKRSAFLMEMKRHTSIKRAILMTEPKFYVKQSLKCFLYHTHILTAPKSGIQYCIVITRK